MLGVASVDLGRAQNGYVRTYALLFFTGVVLIIGYFLATTYLIGVR